MSSLAAVRSGLAGADSTGAGAGLVGPDHGPPALLPPPDGSPAAPRAGAPALCGAGELRGGEATPAARSPTLRSSSECLDVQKSLCFLVLEMPVLGCIKSDLYKGIFMFSTEEIGKCRLRSVTQGSGSDKRENRPMRGLRAGGEREAAAAHLRPSSSVRCEGAGQVPPRRTRSY